MARALTSGPLVVTARWVSDMCALFERTHDVLDHQGCRNGPPANKKIGASEALEIIHILIDSPEQMLTEDHAEFEASTGKMVHYSTFCKAVKALGFTRGTVRCVCVCVCSHVSVLRRLTPCLWGLWGWGAVLCFLIVVTFVLAVAAVRARTRRASLKRVLAHIS